MFLSFLIGLAVGFPIGLCAGKRRACGEGWCKLANGMLGNAVLYAKRVVSAASGSFGSSGSSGSSVSTESSQSAQAEKCKEESKGDEGVLTKDESKVDDAR